MPKAPVDLCDVTRRERVVVIEIGCYYMSREITHVRRQPFESREAKPWIVRMDEPVPLGLRERLEPVEILCRQRPVHQDDPGEILFALGKYAGQAGNLEELEPSIESLRIQRIPIPIECWSRDFFERVPATIAESSDQEMLECHARSRLQNNGSHWPSIPPPRPISSC